MILADIKLFESFIASFAAIKCNFKESESKNLDVGVAPIRAAYPFYKKSLYRKVSQCT